MTLTDRFASHLLCPWSGLTQVPSEWCEQSLCSWVRQPANTWSNIGFFIVGVVILRWTARGRSRHLRGLGYVCLVTAVGSAFYHASETFLGRFADYVGMYSGASYMLAVNVSRWRKRAGPAVRALFWVTLLGPLGGMLLAPRMAVTLYVIETVFCCLGLEVALFVRERKSIRYRSLAIYWAIFLAGYAFWQLDIHHLLCNPGNHVINGHAAWHLLDAAGLLYLFFYYEQFDVLRESHVQVLPAP
ncbi:MAG: ceramidase domain-containing protein [Thermoanaerobaculia bacterium]